MSDRTNHRRVLHFAVTGVLLGGAAGCTSNEPPKADAKADAKESKGRVIVNEERVDPPEPKPEDMKLAPNPGPNELPPQPIVAPTTAVEPKPEPTPEPTPDEHVNEGPVDPPKPPTPVGIDSGPQPEPREPDPSEPPKRVNTGPVTAPPTAAKGKIEPIKVNSGPEG